MNEDQLIRNWHARAADEDYFSRFIFEYLAFIAILRKKRFLATSDDRSAIQSLKQDEDMKNGYFLDIENNSNLKNSWRLIISELETKSLGNVSGNSTNAEELKWWNCSHSQLNSQTELEKNQTKGKVSSLQDWVNMVEFWHSIRNNLFHAGKDPQDGRDQFLVEHGYKTLRPLIERLLDEEGIF